MTELPKITAKEVQSIRPHGPSIPGFHVTIHSGPGHHGIASNLPDALRRASEAWRYFEVTGVSHD